MKHGLLLAAGLGALIISSPARAATIIETFNFQAVFPSVVVKRQTVEPPTKTLQGQFTISYDVAAPSLAKLISISGLKIGDTIFQASDPTKPGYTGIIYGTHSAAGNPTYSIGGTMNGVSSPQIGTNDFLLTFQPVNRLANSMIYSQVGNARVWVADLQPSVEVSMTYVAPVIITPVVPVTPVTPVPEPGTWLMMIAGFGFVGAAMRRSGRHKALQSLSA